MTPSDLFVTVVEYCIICAMQCPYNSPSTLLDISLCSYFKSSRPFNQIKSQAEKILQKKIPLPRSS